MDVIYKLRDRMNMKIEDPFSNTNFSENFPKWIHIWISTIGLGTGILFILNTIYPLVDKDNSILRLFACMGLISLVLLLFNRDTYLPFLSENFLPEIFLDIKERKPKKADKFVRVQVEPNSKVLYWAADPGKEVSTNWKKGYGKFENSGIIISDNKGNAVIPIECPNRYIVHGYKILPKHVHYRVYNKDNQMLSRVYTLVLTNDCN
jgi:hypothetical protein